VSEGEIRRLAESQTAVSHNASINAKRGRIPPAIDILERGGTVAIGTDNYHGNITEVWKFAISAARVRTGDASRLTPMQVLEMATVNGARALGRLDDLGSLEPGKCADLVIVDLQKPHFYPLIDPVGSLVHNMVGNDVDTVMVDGRIVIDGGRLQTVPPEEILAGSQRTAERVWARLRAQYPGV
jgi:5-methylthioadenosine/S-adenosylhomocysteine deaminase